jgi:hypothetical protein
MVVFDLAYGVLLPAKGRTPIKQVEHVMKPLLPQIRIGGRSLSFNRANAPSDSFLSFSISLHQDIFLFFSCVIFVSDRSFQIRSSRT